MKPNARVWVFFGFLLALGGLPVGAAAQQGIRCESNDGRRNYCGRYAPGEIQLERQISGSPCVEGSTWGVDDGGLWVDRGCRAEFSILPRDDRGEGDRGAQQPIRCESNDGRRNYCGQYDGGQVRLERQISGSPCIEGSTWGVDDGGLWVDRGCRAEFSILPRDDRGEGDRGAQQGIRCESNDGRRNYCGRYAPGEIQLERQISGSPCVEGSTWGVDDGGLWVDRGCRAEFSILPRDDRGEGDRGAQQGIRCESNDGRRNYCGRYDRGELQLERQISGSPCVEGSTWGVDDGGLWVDRGCRAEFSILPRDDRGEGDRGAQGRGPAWLHPGRDKRWPPAGDWNGGNWDRGGACFYKGYNFTGDYFCVRRGESLRSIGNFGDKISSIRVFGGARVVVFNDRDYRNGQDVTGSDVRDLREWRMSSRPSHTWNRRISSLQVR
ncbi:MAG TPA: DUF3011 domain-containing protein [Candidatus Acidoferrales bacterium]|nr:DUF3011 domain-containing protein [Candidatus Acidoferrales bacterium]